jgi:hypothetical protein
MPSMFYICVWCGATSPTPQREHARTCSSRPVIVTVPERSAGSGAAEAPLAPDRTADYDSPLPCFRD